MGEPRDRAVLRVYTIGHSTRTLDDLVAVLVAHGVECLVDVRRFPGSRRLPQFTADAMTPALAQHAIDYHWIGTLGGRRRPDPDSPNTGWRHPAFRAYADHVASEEFADGLVELLTIAHGLRTAIMCSEVLWWRCHRRLVADVLVSLGAEVVHLRDATHAEVHRLAPPATFEDGILGYAAA